jgi:hypothetical protein
VLCVRWYLSFKLSYQDLVSMMNERGIAMAHTTILRWVRHYTPEFEKRWKRYARPVGDSWRMDETYVKVRGEWVYFYRAGRVSRDDAGDLASRLGCVIGVGADRDLGSDRICFNSEFAREPWRH